MARVLVLSSWVAHGHVGLSAAAPALQALGHSVTQLPTVRLSNHPGWPRVAGRQVPVDDIDAMIDALDANGWLAGLDSVLTGYLPSPAHVEFARGLVARIGREGRRPRIVVDPVLGDRPKGLYVEAAAARTIRDRLVPMADTLTPNAFELGWLTGLPTETLAETAHAAAQLRDMANGADVFVTSPPVSPAETGLLAVSERSALYRVPRADPARVPHGPGDVFSAFLAAGLAPGAALGHLQALVAASLGAPHLRIAEAAPDWTAAEPIGAEAIDGAEANAVR